MGEKRLDFDAPLLSVRRIASKAESRPKAVGNPGLIPCTWEHSPGRPKRPTSSCPLPLEDKILKGRDGDRDGDEDEIISRNDSSLDCSVSGCSSSSDVAEHSVSFSKDPEVGEFMMGRFLLAAKAMATGPLEIAAPKEHQRFTTEDLKLGDSNLRRSPVHLPYQHRPNIVPKFASYQEEVDSYVDDDDVHEDHFGGACGLIPQFCLTSSFLLLNPVQGMKVRNHRPPHSLTNSEHGFVSAADESWDAVFKHKTGCKDDSLEDWSKPTSESNQLTSWSDSQTLDESSYRHSPQSPILEGKVSVGVLKRELKGRKTLSFDWCDRVGGKTGKLRPFHGKQSRRSPSVDRIIYVTNVLETPRSESRSADMAADTADEDSADLADDDSDLTIRKKDELQPKIFELVEAGLSSCPEKSSIKGAHCSDDQQLALKVEDEEKNSGILALSVLPPPLPKSPTESWLQRTLPSVSSKYPSTQSSLGIQVQHKKQLSWASSKDFTWANDARSLKGQIQQTRFSQAVRKHAVQQWEL